MFMYTCARVHTQRREGREREREREKNKCLESLISEFIDNWGGKLFT